MNSAHWIQKTHLFRPDEYVCSACARSCDKPYSVCPVCGAQMGNTKYDPSWVDEAAYLSTILEDDW